MYAVAVKRDFVAQHFLVGGDWGPENQKHSHHYQVELQLEGRELDQHGYLVDIVDIERALDALVAHYRDQTINELPEFEALNPSIEHFSRILCQALAAHIQAENIRRIAIKLWENDIAWASFRLEKRGRLSDCGWGDMLRLGLLIYDSLENVSGGYLYDRQLVQHLHRQGDRVEIFSIPRRGYLRNLLDNFSPRLRRRLEHADVDLMLQDELCHPSLFWLNRRLRRTPQGRGKPTYPIVTIVHHLYSSELRPAWQNHLYSLIERRYLSSVDGFIFNSQTTCRSVEQWVTDLEHRPNLVAYPAGDQFNPCISEAEIQQRVLKPGPLRLLFVGNVIPRKGLHTLLEALAGPGYGAGLPRDGGETEQGWTLSVVGNLQVDRPYTRRIRRQIARLGLAGFVELCGALLGDDLAERMKTHHVLVVPSTYEGYGIAYLEGMGYGLPAIATNAGAAGEIITHGMDGCLLPPGDIPALRDCLSHLAGDRLCLLKLSLAARQRYLAQPTWEQTGGQIRDFLENML